jgi:hypothetical protein
MSHTSQRRGLDPGKPGQEIIVLAMVSKRHRQDEGIPEAMKVLAQEMLAHNPHQWLSHNFLELDIPQLGSMQSLLRLVHRLLPEATQDFLFRAVAEKSSVLTALYTGAEDACSLLRDLKGSWLEDNRRKGLPISIVVSGLFADIDKCCKQTGIHQHTYLHCLEVRGRVDRLPGEAELELVTMCGHGLIATGRVQGIVDRMAKGEITAEQAAEDVGRPCVCGIVNQERAAEIFRRLAGSERTGAGCSPGRPDGREASAGPVSSSRVFPGTPEAARRCGISEG